MTEPPTNTDTNTNTVTNLLTTHHALLDTLSSFLVVTTHHILYLRRIYPPISFVSTRAYNYPVRQNRHPDVCTWINDAVDAIRDQMERNTVDKVALCIFECHQHRVLERWTFDLHAFPAVAKRDSEVPIASPDDELERKINFTDLEANFRAVLSRINSSAARLRPLPEGDGAPECSFTMTIEVKDAVARPVGRLDPLERHWVAAEPEQFDRRDKSDSKAKDKDGVSGKTHPVRRLEADELRMEVWVEESAAKYTFPSSQMTTSERNGSMSYGSGTEKFDPLLGYDLEKPDINRKPGGGIGTDYQRQV